MVETVAPVVVPAVLMMCITTRTAGRVTSRHGDSGRLTGQETLCPNPFDGIASVTRIAQLDRVVIVGRAREILCAARARVLPLSALAPPERQRNQRCDRYQE